MSRRAPPPVQRYCEGKNRNGTDCSYLVREPNIYCGHHSAQANPQPQAIRQRCAAKTIEGSRCTNRESTPGHLFCGKHESHYEEMIERDMKAMTIKADPEVEKIALYRTKIKEKLLLMLLEDGFNVGQIGQYFKLCYDAYYDTNTKIIIEFPEFCTFTFVHCVTGFWEWDWIQCRFVPSNKSKAAENYAKFFIDWLPRTVNYLFINDKDKYQKVCPRLKNVTNIMVEDAILEYLFSGTPPGLISDPNTVPVY